MSKSVSGGSTGGSSSSTNTFSSLYADSFTNYVGMTSPMATITDLTSTTVDATTIIGASGEFTTLTATTATASSSLTSPAATITALTSTNASISNVTSSAIVNSGTINTHHLTASGDVVCANCTISGNLSYDALDMNAIVAETVTVGTVGTSFPSATSEYDASTIIYDSVDHKFGDPDWIDKRTSFGIANYGTDLTVSEADIGTENSVDFPTVQTSYINADTNATVSSTDMTVAIVFRLTDLVDSAVLISYDTAQPSFNLSAGTLYLERAGKYNLNTGITFAIDTNYILVATLSSTTGIQLRVNGVELYTNTTSYGTYSFFPSLCLFGRHWNNTTQFFIGKLGNVMTAASVLTTEQIENIETYLSSKYSIATGLVPVVKSGDPFSTGSGTITIYGGMNSTGTVSASTLSLTGNATAAGAVTAASLSVSADAAIFTATIDHLFTRGLYQEMTTAATEISANLYNVYYTNHGIFYISGADNPTANFSLNIIYLPTDTTYTCTLSLIYYQTSSAYYCNGVSASDASGNYLLGGASTYTAPKFAGGTPSFTTSPNLVIQQFSLFSIPDAVGTMTRYVVSSVSPYY